MFSLAPIGFTYPSIPEQSGRPAIAEKARGKMKGAAGVVTGDDEKKAEGRAQQRKGAAKEEASQKEERTRKAEAEAKRAEEECDGQGLKDERRLATPSGAGPIRRAGESRNR